MTRDELRAEHGFSIEGTGASKKVWDYLETIESRLLSMMDEKTESVLWGVRFGYRHAGKGYSFEKTIADASELCTKTLRPSQEEKKNG